MKYVVGIGAANADIYGKSTIKIREHYDHPAHILTAVGGVTRNVLENISKLGIKAKLLTAVGDDNYGDYVLKESKKAGLDMKDALIVKGGHTGVFMQVQDNNNDMHLALCDMSIIKQINREYIDSKDEILKKAEVIIIDPSLDNEIIDYVLTKYADKPIFVDPISDLYAKKIKPYVGKINLIKPNKTELENLSGNKIENEEDIIKAYKKVIKKGCKDMFVSCGSKGCAYTDDKGEVVFKCFKEVKKMVNASGAGDAFMAALVYGYVNKLSKDEMTDYALAAGIAAIKDKHVINPDFSVELLRKIIKENKK